LPSPLLEPAKMADKDDLIALAAIAAFIYMLAVFLAASG
jgi:hypothetical protein